MLPDQAASPAFFRKLLTCGLCMLAVVFAIEAKTAWYGPATAPGSAVQFAKALPADLPQVVSHGIPTPDPFHPAIPFLVIATFLLSVGPENRMMRKALRGARTPQMASFFIPQLFFRPPPIL
jgi:hypothetical protein